MNNLIKAENQISENILERCKNGDASAFREIVKKYQKYTYNLAFKILLNGDDAKDIVQESFIRVWRNIYLFNDQIKFTTWLYKITVNLCYDKIKSARRREKVITNHIDLEELQKRTERNCELKIINEQLAAIIGELSNELPEKQRMVFILRDLQELSIEEVSVILNISVGSVKTNLVYARRNIKEKLIKYLK
jgi:RNA polymerase sigma-70 factor, ECF subfamily